MPPLGHEALPTAKLRFDYKAALPTTKRRYKKQRGASGAKRGATTASIWRFSSQSGALESKGAIGRNLAPP